MVTPLRGLAGRLDWRSPASGGNRHLVTPNLTVSPLPRYTRPREETVAAPLEGIIPFTQSDPAIDASTLSAGSRALLRGLLRVGSTRMFPGGGAGIEYGGLLKTAARPDYIAAHVVEAANHLREREADLLLVPACRATPWARCTRSRRAHPRCCSRSRSLATPTLTPTQLVHSSSPRTPARATS